MALSLINQLIFQLTPPIRAATIDFLFCSWLSLISTHATHKGGDSANVVTDLIIMQFQLTPPIRAATHMTVPARPSDIISTHATHKGGDVKISFFKWR